MKRFTKLVFVVVGLTTVLFACMAAVGANTKLVAKTVFEHGVEEQYRILGRYDYTRFSVQPETHVSCAVIGSMKHYGLALLPSLGKSEEDTWWQDISGGKNAYVYHADRAGDFDAIVREYQTGLPGAVVSWNSSRTMCFLRLRTKDGKALLDITVAKRPKGRFVVVTAIREY